DYRRATNLAKEMDHMLGSGQTRQVAVNDDAVEAVINERQQMAEQAGEEFHGQPHDTRSRSEKDSKGTGPTYGGGWQEFYLPDLDLAAIGTKLERRTDPVAKRPTHLRVVK